MAKAKKATKAAKAAPKAAKSSDDGKIYAIVSYIGLLGWIIALILNKDKKDALASFHIRQSLIIMLAAIPVWILAMIPVIGWFLLGPAGCIALFVFWLMGLISAIKGEQKEVPLIGKLGQDWFKSL